MPKLQKKTCNSCGFCVSKCPFGVIEMLEGKPKISENCTECGVCVKSCPKKALIAEDKKSEGQLAQKEKEEYRGFWVVGLPDTTVGLSKVSMELLSEARRLADIKKSSVTFLTVGKTEDSDIMGQAVVTGCDYIKVIEGEASPYQADILVNAVTEVIKKNKPEAVLFPATVHGRDLAPKIACRLKTGLTADCTGLDIDKEGNLVQIRPTYGGSIIASIITPNHRPQMASVRPGVMEIVKTTKAEVSNISIERLKVEEAKQASRTIFVKSEEIDSTFDNLGDAKVIIAGGYGLKNKKNLEKLFALCNKLNAQAAATRKVVDEGWAPAEIQVGQTGVTVAPDIYIAFGVSGALQHTLGIKRAKKVVAINNDPAAPIFDICDVAILGDAAEVLEQCCQKIQNEC